MSQANVQIVRRVYEQWSRGDFSEGEAFHPEIEFEMVDWPGQAEVNADTATVWTIEAGKVVRLALHWNRADALEAAGMGGQ
jgi:ketosteroid isomerase-like protein